MSNRLSSMTLFMDSIQLASKSPCGDGTGSEWCHGGGGKMGTQKSLQEKYRKMVLVPMSMKRIGLTMARFLSNGTSKSDAFVGSSPFGR